MKYPQFGRQKCLPHSSQERPTAGQGDEQPDGSRKVGISESSALESSSNMATQARKEKGNSRKKGVSFHFPVAKVWEISRSERSVQPGHGGKRLRRFLKSVLTKDKTKAREKDEHALEVYNEEGVYRTKAESASENSYMMQSNHLVHKGSNVCGNTETANETKTCQKSGMFTTATSLKLEENSQSRDKKKQAESPKSYARYKHKGDNHGLKRSWLHWLGLRRRPTEGQGRGVTAAPSESQERHTGESGWSNDTQRQSVSRVPVNTAKGSPLLHKVSRLERRSIVPTENELGRVHRSGVRNAHKSKAYRPLVHMDKVRTRRDVQGEKLQDTRHKTQATIQDEMFQDTRVKTHRGIQDKKPRDKTENRREDSDPKRSDSNNNMQRARHHDDTSASTGGVGFKDEFGALEKYQEHLLKTLSFSSALQNMDKNRFSALLAPDHSRVMVEKVEVGDTDYYNASHIELGTGVDYIAAQSPFSPSTANDFWRLLLQNRVETVVMLCNCVEGGHTKSHQYWADRGVFVGGAYLCLTEGEETFADYVIRKLKVSSPGHDDVMMTHFQFLTWPWSGVPDDPQPLLELRCQVRRYHGNRDTPIAVHCATGMSRTAVFLAVDSLIDEYAKDGSVKVFQFVKKMRKSRPHMVPTLQQYSFIYQCLFHAQPQPPQPQPQP
ncbi:uncharacterized protein LOC101845149, partial [Aplysia californica]|uniref:Uncharacterized protein LOC101845149 n=1 Tax=Aplysia californica TaxID=6500 RepID=A0ABM0JE07_APLCA